MSKANVKIAAVAANEGAYLPQWLHHHHYFGFTGFDIYVNNTTDNTLEILERLKTWYPGLCVHNMDWIDGYFEKNKPYKVMQTLTYTHDYYNSKDYDYVLYIDIDEFWTPLNFKDTIQVCIERFNYPDCIFFNWFDLDGMEHYLTPIFSRRKFYGKNWRTVKTLLRTGLSLRKMDTHCPFVDYLQNVVIGNGENHILYRDEPWALHPQQATCEKSYFIVHDHVRNLINHLSKIIKGRVSQLFDNNPDVRLAGGRPLHRVMASNGNETLVNKLPRNYFSEFIRMFQKLDLYEEHRQAKIYDCLNALECLRYLSSNPNMKMSARIVKHNGSFSKLHDEIFTILVSYEPEFEKCRNVAMCNPDDLVRDNLQITIDMFLSACHLYPYAKDEYGDPLFIKSLIRLILEHGDFSLALKIATKQNTYSHCIGQKRWFLELFINAYRKQQIPEEALKLYRRMEYMMDKSIWNSIEELKRTPKSM